MFGFEGVRNIIIKGRKLQKVRYCKKVLQHQKGSITIFLSIILVVVILFTGVMIDFARIKSAKGIVASALDIAVQSTLAGYHGELKKEYGLMALYNNNHSDLSQYIKENLRNNLGDSTVSGQQLHLYNFEIESVNVTPMNELSQYDITREQIINFMKYRAPVGMIEGFVNKLRYFGSITKETQLLSYKTSLDKKTGKLRSAMVGLYCETKRVYGFDSNSVKQNIDRGKSLHDDIAHAKGCIDECNYEIERLNMSIERIKQNAKNVSDKKAKALYDSEIKQLNQNKDSCYEQIKSLKNEIGDLRTAFNNIVQKTEQLILDCIEANSKAGVLISEIEIGTTNIEKEIKRILKDIKSETSDTAQKIRLEMNRTAKSVSVDTLDKYKLYLKENIFLLQRVLAQLGKVRSDSVDFDMEMETIDRMIEQYQSGEIYQPAPNGVNEYEIQQYNNIDADNYSPKINDIRKIVTETSEKVLSKKEQEGVVLSEKQRVGLPSHEGEVSQKMGLNYAEPSNDTFGEQANFNGKNDQGFSEKGFSFSGGVGKGLDTLFNQVTNIRDEIYFNEYIMMSFKNITSGAENLPKLNRLDLRGDLLVDKNTVFNNGEIEYILNGSPNEGTNILLTKGEILAVRFGLNTLRIYSDATKNSQALSMAATVAGWTGVGIPIVHTMIMCAWAFGESLIDMQVLCSGGEVELYKMNWVLSLEGGIDKLKQTLIHSSIDKGCEYLNSRIDALEQKANELLINKTELIVNKAFEPFEQTIQGGMKSTSNEIKEQIDMVGFNSDMLILGEIEEYIKGIVINKLAEVQSVATGTILEKKELIKREMREAILYGTGEAGQQLKEYSKMLKQEIKKIVEKGTETLKEYAGTDVGSISQPKDSGIIASFIKLSYMDYLRVFLLLQDKEKTVGRIEDLIQLNIQKIDPTFMLSDYHTLIKVEASVSVNHLFNISSIIRNRNQNKRKVIQVELYKGY